MDHNFTLSIFMLGSGSVEEPWGAILTFCRQGNWDPQRLGMSDSSDVAKPGHTHYYVPCNGDTGDRHF